MARYGTALGRCNTVEIGEMKVVDLEGRTVAGVGTHFAGTGPHCGAEYGGERGTRGVVHETHD
jgi:hypothetical protein